MTKFEEFLEKTQEIGYVDLVLESLVYAQGLPQAHLGELVIFETGQLGSVLSINATNIEILLLSPAEVAVGTRIVRTGRSVQIKLDDSVQGKTLFMSRLEQEYLTFDEASDEVARRQIRPVEVTDSQFTARQKVTHHLETGVSMVDLYVPLGKGQRELVIGDRKTGKSSLLLQLLRTQVQQGSVCIYAAIAQPQFEIQRLRHFFAEEQLEGKVTMVTSHAADPAGIIFLTPYVAMTVAEYFRDQGKDVVLFLDDLTTHAKYYREVMLLAKRFPGRSSYPSDIFYIHSRLLERAGSFKRGSITCLPVAQSVGGDLTGYIQSNLMSMTDGHIFFDEDLFDQGRRPAINPFLSVTRVGEQTQTPLLRSMSRQLRSFLTSYEKIKQFKHFQTELTETAQITFDRGSRLTVMMDQLSDVIVPLPVNMILCASLWAEFWKNVPLENMHQEMARFRHNYKTQPDLQKKVHEVIDQSNTFEELIQHVKEQDQVILESMRSAKELPATEKTTAKKV